MCLHVCVLMHVYTRVCVCVIVNKHVASCVHANDKITKTIICVILYRGMTITA